MGDLKRAILDIIFPRRCLGCKIPLSGNGESYLCQHCLAGIKIKNDFACAFCGSPVIAGLTCYFCRPAHFLDRLLVATSYENPLVEKIIKTMKYGFVRPLADDMAELMARYLKARLDSGLNIKSDLTIVSPVPLHRRRLNWRGFNQAEIIGGVISSRFKLDFQNILKRKHSRAPQARIANRELRIANARGIFECPRPELVRGKAILLVDDVATTSSTLDDCARALKDGGAKEVIGLVFARGTLAWDQKLLKK